MVDFDLSKKTKDWLVLQLEKQNIFKTDIADRVTVRADINTFKYKEDESVWKQFRGKTARYFEAYFDGMNICDFTDAEPQLAIVTKFMVGLRNCLLTGKVHINPTQAQQEKAVAAVIEEKKIDENEDRKKLEKIDNMALERKEDKIRQKLLKRVVAKKIEKKKRKGRLGKNKV